MKTHKKLVIFLLVISIAVSLMTSLASASPDGLAYGAATVDVPVLNLRAGPGVSHDILTRLSAGDVVVILERTSSQWYRVTFHGTVGYVNTDYLKDVLVAENFSALGRVNGNAVNIRSKPDITSQALGKYSTATTMSIIGINNGWYKVSHDGHTGYVRSDLMEIISGYKPSSEVRTAAVAGTPHANSALGIEIADFALTFVGSKYLRGGASPAGFDCSGFVTFVMRNFGISVTRTASGQYRDNGVKIDKADLYPGDLIFTSNNGGRSVTHVGIYIGDGEFVHASTSSTGVIISRLDSAYNTRAWYGAKRVV